MMGYRVRLTLEAKHQIQAISSYIAEDSLQNARNWRHSLRERIRSLQHSPERHEIAYRVNEVGRDIRHTFYGVYRILYAIESNTVVIVSVRHGARKPLTAEELRRID